MVRGSRAIRQLGRQLGRSLGLWLGLALLLTGCFQADLTLRFDHHHHGQWTQVITLGERNLAFASDALSPWLQQVRVPVQRLGGYLRQTPASIQVTVPFSTPADLATRFEIVLAEASAGPETLAPLTARAIPTPEDDQGLRLDVPGLGKIPVHLETQERNWGLFSQVRLIYDIDLPPVPLPTDSVLGAPSLRTDSLSFQLQVPWGRISPAPDSLSPSQTTATAARWVLPLGQPSHIDVRFWLPNWIGLGGIIIAVAVLLGYGIRYRWLGPPR